MEKPKKKASWFVLLFRKETDREKNRKTEESKQPRVPSPEFAAHDPRAYSDHEFDYEEK